MYNSTYTFSTSREDRTQKIGDRKCDEDENKETRETKTYKTEWVICLEDWRDIVTMYIPQLNTIPIGDN